MTKSFFHYDKPVLTAMVQDKTPDSAICTIMDSLYDGAEAFGIQLCNLLPEYRTEEHLTRIFKACEGRPIYITSYRGGASKGLSDEECVELLLMGLRAGVSMSEMLCDVMGDVYGKTQDQLSFEPAVIERQRALIDRIHAMGGKVLISTHLSRFFEEDELMEYAHAQHARGADLVKIVTKADTPEQEAANLMITYRLKRELDCPFLFLSGGMYTRLIRQIGPALGCCMYLCVQRYHPVTAKAQPLLRSVKAIRDNMLL